jgi:hypothetical protein
VPSKSIYPRIPTPLQMTPSPLHPNSHGVPSNHPSRFKIVSQTLLHHLPIRITDGIIFILIRRKRIRRGIIWFRRGICIRFIILMGGFLSSSFLFSSHLSFFDRSTKQILWTLGSASSINPSTALPSNFTGDGNEFSWQHDARFVGEKNVTAGGFFFFFVFFWWELVWCFFGLFLAFIFETFFFGGAGGGGEPMIPY